MTKSIARFETAKHLTSQRQVDLTKENHLRIFIWEQTAVQLPVRGDSHRHIGIAIFQELIVETMLPYITGNLHHVTYRSN